MTGVIYIGPLTAHHPNHQMSSITPSLHLHTMYNTLFKQFTNILSLINSISAPKSSTRDQRFTIYILHILSEQYMEASPSPYARGTKTPEEKPG